VNLSSGAQRFSDIRWEDPNFKDGYDPKIAYAQSKTAAVLFAVELDRRWARYGIRGYAVHPGVVVGSKINSSKIRPARRTDDDAMREMGLIDAAGNPVIDPAAGKKTVPQGAATIVFAATSPLLAKIGGVYLKDNDISRLDDDQKPLTADQLPSEVTSHSVDPRSARRLWELSERLLATEDSQAGLRHAFQQ
jgi:NAD(P)-dependent dehydrogenase (short-subunit alcohol dehydrogenase family)